MRGIVGEERRGKETDGCPLTKTEIAHFTEFLTKTNTTTHHTQG
jgi:hypothetical protein